MTGEWNCQKFGWISVSMCDDWKTVCGTNVTRKGTNK